MSSVGGSDHPPGARLGRYELLARLGKGGMALVHLALSRGLGGFNKLVVLKRLDSDDEDFRRMFLEEARLAALLHHPNVVNTYEVSETDGSYFIAMEYLQGQPLDKLIRTLRKRGKLLEPRFCARIVADALSGLQYAHELCDYNGAPLEVVHRDVSPHNLFVTYAGTVKLLDFGVAKTKSVESATQVGVLKGKLAYMAPEQAAGRPVDRRADVFAAGAVLWELLTLERLRQSDSPEAMLNEALRGSIPDLGKLRSGVSRQLEGVLWQALALDPARRYPSAQAMREALLGYLSVEPCSSEQLAELLQQLFGDLREQTQRQIAEWLKRAETADPIISITHEEDAPGALLFGSQDDERSLPLMDSGSLPAQERDSLTALRDSLPELERDSANLGHDDATTPLAPASLRSLTPPSPTPEAGLMARSRSTFAGEDAAAGILRGWMLLAAALVIGIFLFASRRPNAERDPDGSLRPPAQRLDEQAATTLLRLHGSNTIGAELAPRLAEAFLKQQGYQGVKRSAPGEVSSVSGRDPHDGKLYRVEIVALGSATAFSDLAASRCDVGLASRRIKLEEVKLLREKGLGNLASPAGEHVLGLDGIAVIVHPNSPLQRVDIPTLKRLFSGQVRDFSDAGGSPGPVHVYARDDRSGTYDLFEHLVLDGLPLAPQAERFSDSVELSSAVARDPQGIGFIGIPYVRGARALAIAAPGAVPLYPSSFTIATEGYELSRRLYLYLPVQHLRPLALELVNFALSPAGQALVRDSGFVDLTLRPTATGPCSSCPARYAELARSAKRLSLDFRFESASADLDSRGLRDLGRVLAYLRENSQARLTLVGFSDARGSTPQNLRLSLERAKKVATELRERGVDAVDVDALGSELPVASNDNDIGREKNRRVEVWVQ